VEISEEAPVLEQAPAVVYPTRFYVLAASYTTKTQAEAYLASLRNRGFEAEYAGEDANGTHLVAYGTYTTMDDASSMLASVSLSNKEARIVPAN
jgi:cell division protein FtsN